MEITRLNDHVDNARFLFDYRLLVRERHKFSDYIRELRASRSTCFEFRMYAEYMSG